MIKQEDYDIAWFTAGRKTGIKTNCSTKSDYLIIAHAMDTSVLEAVVTERIMRPNGTYIMFVPEWKDACMGELTDRILLK
jgi:hypothetical protein